MAFAAGGATASLSPSQIGSDADVRACVRAPVVLRWRGDTAGDWHGVRERHQVIYHATALRASRAY